MRYLKVLILFFLFSVLFQLTATSANAGPCTITNGEYSETDIKNGVDNTDCGAIPAKYEIIVYEAYLCSSAATIPTTTAVADLSMCTNVLKTLLAPLIQLLKMKISIWKENRLDPLMEHTHILTQK